MLRSMFSGISGMKNFQTKLDVIGNNIANVNTYGYKKGRVTFKETMSQTIAGASAAQANRGGKNPMQVGLGSTLASIDTIHTQSSLQTTGRSLDLGIDGDGYFVVKQGNAEFYTRAGNFYLDDNGTLVNSDGMKVQAFKYNDAGELTNNYEDVAVNVNAVVPPITTTGIAFSENLSANANVGTVFSQQIKVVDKDGIPRTSTVYFKKLGQDNWGVYTNKNPQSSSAIATGGLKVTAPQTYTGTTKAKWDLKYFTGGTPIRTGYFIDIPGQGTNIPLKLNQNTMKLEPENITDLPKLQGIELDVSAIDKKASATGIAAETNSASGNIKFTDQTAYSGTQDKTIKLTYNAASNSWSYIDVNAPGTPVTIPFDFITKKSTSTIDGLQLDISDITAPGDGDSWTIEAKAKTPQPTSYTSPATPQPIATLDVTPATKPDHILNFVNGKILNGNTKFTMNMSIPSGLKDDTDTIADESLQTLYNVEYDFSKLTQVDGTNTALLNTNGNTEGKLESFNIGAMGEINGVYSNGQIITLGQLALAKFSNTSGLTKATNNLFQESVNSGKADINVAGEGRGTIASGSLEMSNVDLSEEFTEMITAQRGFQANTKIITTSDEILQELVNLKR